MAMGDGGQLLAVWVREWMESLERMMGQGGSGSGGGGGLAL